ncbi:MAG: DNA mismatch repair protein MutS [Bacillota bacterium]|nr:DNA mismatch repair protein MutS [Bacillota bacterium]
MLRQYRALKEKHRDSILLFRLGDFYEGFYEDAEVMARELGITLTSREMGKGNRAPMAGIPYRAAEGYISRLVERGHRVAICEQVEDAGKARGLVRREVVRTVTPGTVSEGRLLEDRGHRWLAGLCVHRRAWGLASADASTGEFRVTQLEGPDAARLALEELARLAPAECLVPASLAADPGIGQVMREAGGILTPRDEPEFAPEEARSRLLSHFQVASLGGYGCEGQAAAVGAAGAVLKYLGETQGTCAHVRELVAYQVGEHLVIDPTARRNLELFHRWPDGRTEGTLCWVLDQTVTPAAGRRLRSWLERPLTEPARIEERLDAVEEMAGDALLREELRDLLRHTCDGERLLARAATGALTPRELGHVRRTLGILPRVREVVSRATSNLVGRLGGRLDAPAELVDLLNRALGDDPPVSPHEGGIIREGFSPEVDGLRQAAREGRTWLARLEAEERERTGIKSLKIGYNQVFGYYFEVTRANLSLVPADWTRQQTLAGAERFFTGRLKELESTILGAQEKLERVECDLFSGLRERVVDHRDTLAGAFSALADLDALAALAEVAVRHGYVRPLVDDGDAIWIEDGRHPVLERMMGEGEFVPNSVALDAGCRLLVITGPNMAGKSTYMRQVALVVVMAQMGSFVPARRARVGVVDRLFVRVGAYDDIASGQSTFMVEMSEVARALRHATARSLVILDEIGRGTGTFDGMSIAWAVAEHLHDRVGCHTLLATHYRELIALGERLPAAANCSVAVRRRGRDIIFLRRVVPGGADASYGVEVAKLAGLPEAVVERAGDILARLEAGGSHPHRAALEAAATSPDRADPGMAGRVREQAPLQLTFLSPPASPLVRELAELDPLRMTPIEAIARLHELSERARREIGHGTG